MINTSPIKRITFMHHIHNCKVTIELYHNNLSGDYLGQTNGGAMWVTTKREFNAMVKNIVSKCTVLSIN